MWVFVRVADFMFRTRGASLEHAMSPRGPVRISFVMIRFGIRFVSAACVHLGHVANVRRGVVASVWPNDIMLAFRNGYEHPEHSLA